MKKNITASVIFFVLCTSIILGLNIAPTIAFVRHSPSDRYFPLLHNNSQDFYFYISLMQEGASDNWLTTIPFTTESHSPSLVFNYFLIIGKISGTFNIPMELGYLIARIVSSILFFISAFILIHKLKIPYPKLAYLFFLFASPFLRTVTENGQQSLSPFLYWWTGIDAIRRASYLPHHMFGGFLLISILILLIHFIQTEKLKYFIFSLLLIFPLLLIHTPSLLILILILPSAAVGFLLKRNLLSFWQALARPESVLYLKERFRTSRNDNTRNYLLLTFYSLLGAFLLFVFAKLMQSDPLWKHALDWEKTLQLPFLSEIAGAFGILLPFALLGIVRSILSKKFSFWLVVSWFLVPILFIPLAPLFQISNTRLVQGVPYLPFAMLAVIGIDALNHWKLIENFPGWLSREKIILGIILVLFTAQSVTTLIWSMKDQIHEYWTPYSNIYLDNRLFEAFRYISGEYKPKTFILSSFYTGNYLPAFTHTTSFIGHFGYTYNLKDKQEKTNNFLSQRLTEEEAKQFLRKNNIRLVFQGPEEKIMNNSPLYPAILNEVYKNDIVTVYQVKT